MAAVIGNREISLGVLGGTLITAACYSGGEVFGCSPYDAATTRYLKATYPLYWAQIRDYGFANPQLVPWINEDNDLIVSLVSVGKVRVTIGENGAYIKTNILPNTDTHIKATYGVDIFNGGANALFGSRISSGNQECEVWAYSTYLTRGWDATGQPNVGSTTSPFPTTIEMKNGEFILNGNKTTQPLGSFVGTKQFYIFGLNTNGGLDSQRAKKLRFAELEIDGHKFVPYYKNGAAGMLDLLDLQWYGNANTSGAFTIEMTDTPT